MTQPVLTIAVPTHNRAQYAVAAIESILASPDQDFELVLSDTSTDHRLKQALAMHPARSDSRLRYDWTDQRFDMTGNHNRVLQMARGDYVCLIGDDDTVGPDLVRAARWAKSNSVEVISPNVTCNYAWPDFISRYFGRGHAGRMYLPRELKPLIRLDSAGARERLLAGAAQGTDLLPKIYHGLVRRSAIDAVVERAGVFFHGSSPDLSGACALAWTIREFIVLDYPLTIPGASGGSNTGRSAVNTHKGTLESESQTSAFRATGWAEGVPRFFSVETVWAHAALTTLKALGVKEIHRFNFVRLMAICELRHREFAAALVQAETECVSLLGTDAPSFRLAVKAEKSRLRTQEVKRIARRLLRPTASGGRAYVGGIADVAGCPARLQTYLQAKGWSWDRYLG